MMGQNWRSAVLVLEQAADLEPDSPSMDATLDHVSNLLGDSAKARAAYAEAERLARMGMCSEAAAHLRQHQPSPVKWLILLAAGVAVFTGLMVALPVGAMLYSFWQEGLIGEGPPGASSEGSLGGMRQTHAGFSETARAFIDATARKDAKAAYEMMSPAYRAGVPLDRFEEKVKSNPYLTGATSVQFRTSSGVLGGMKSTGYLTSSAGTVEAVFHFTQIESVWYVAGLTLAGAPALPH